ncbi:hypothetical protein QVZ43_10625 [Marinobacter sp. chi1]|uniref:Phosphate ABC transporter substrate-binding protein n=1 Tax=Marinobacter suaedae TaxID=3057675 RepID=A0ABT8W1P6_9GAMM|nr:hypothetical protein [Marinobacter sp. chi1]MDO3722176.1 hypothetical protein [Marinobacter sp. chi1]
MKQILSGVLLIWLSSLSVADIYVVTHADSPIETISKEALRDLYLGRARALPNGEFASIYDRKGNADLRSQFYQHVAGMGLSQVDAFWARLVFAGRMLPLEKVEGDQELKEVVAEDKSAISYLGVPPDHPGLKVIYLVSE